MGWTDLVFHFLINTLFNVYLFILILRFLIQAQGVDWSRSIPTLVRGATEFLVRPFNRITPRWHGIEFGTLIVIYLLQALQLYLLYWLSLNIPYPNIFGVLIVALGAMANKFVNIFFFMIVLVVLAHWIPDLRNNRVVYVMEVATSYVLALGRRYIPLVAGWDISPLLVILIMQLMAMYVFFPIVNLGTGIVLS